MQGASLAGMQDLKHVDIFLQHSIAVQSAAAATSIVGDSRSILLGLSDGTCQLFSWQGKVCFQIDCTSHTLLGACMSPHAEGPLSDCYHILPDMFPYSLQRSLWFAVPGPVQSIWLPHRASAAAAALHVSQIPAQQPATHSRQQSEQL